MERRIYFRSLLRGWIAFTPGPAADKGAADEGKGFISGEEPFGYHPSRHAIGVRIITCSAGAGVESVVAVDFRNRMTDGVLKQQC